MQKLYEEFNSVVFCSLIFDIIVFNVVLSALASINLAKLQIFPLFRILFRLLTIFVYLTPETLCPTVLKVSYMYFFLFSPFMFFLGNLYRRADVSSASPPFSTISCLN